MSHHLVTTASFFSPLAKQFMWNIKLQREMNSSVVMHLCYIHLQIAFYDHQVDGRMLGKGKQLTCSNDLRRTNQHFPLHDIISLFRDSRCDSWLLAYQSQQVVDQEWCHLLRTAWQRKQRLQRKNCLRQRQSHTMFTQMAIYIFFFPFLFPSSRCVTSSRPCWMS